MQAATARPVSTVSPTSVSTCRPGLRFMGCGLHGHAYFKDRGKNSREQKQMDMYSTWGIVTEAMNTIRLDHSKIAWVHLTHPPFGNF